MNKEMELSPDQQVVQDALRRETRKQVIFLLSCLIGAAIAVLVVSL